MAASEPKQMRLNIFAHSSHHLNEAPVECNKEEEICNLCNDFFILCILYTLRFDDPQESIKYLFTNSRKTGLKGINFFVTRWYDGS